MLAELSHIRRAFGRAAGTYDANARQQRHVLKQCMELACPHVEGNARVLDLGCGTGQLAVLACEKALPWQITAVDVALPMCRAAALAGVPVANADAHHLPFADASFEAVLSSLTLQWAQDLPQALREISRVLRSSGVAALTLFGPQTLRELKRSFALVDAPPRINHFHSAADLYRTATEAGFQVDNLRSQLERSIYPDAMALLHSLKAIGATTLTQPSGRRGLTTRRTFERLQSLYQRDYGEVAGIPASWEILSLLLHKVDSRS